MSKIDKQNISVIKRWKPDFRYQSEKLIDVELKGFKSTEKSLTDKEKYRVNLASLRGQLASGLGSPTVGSYSLKAGEDYDPDNDFSFLNRPDLSLVELHEFIERKKAELEEFDSNLSSKIKEELDVAQSKLSDLQQKELQKAEINKGGNK